MRKIQKVQIHAEPLSKGPRVEAKFTPDMKELIECCPEGSTIRVLTREGPMITYVIDFPKGKSMASANAAIAKVQAKFRGRARSCSPNVEGLQVSLKVRLAGSGEVSRVSSKSRLVADSLTAPQRAGYKAIAPFASNLVLVEADSKKVLFEANSFSMHPDLMRKLAGLQLHAHVEVFSKKTIRIGLYK